MTSLFSTLDRLPPVLLGFWVLGVGCAEMASPRIVDLTYAFDERTVYWPGNASFHWEKVHWGFQKDGRWYASGKFSASEHGGTHLDAPVHFAKEGRTLDQIPPGQLIGPAVVIDVRSRARHDPDYELQVQDIREWERGHGRILEGELVFLLTGWGAYWADPSRYLGSRTPDDPQTLHFPGFSVASVEFLIKERGIRGVGIDTASIDPGRSLDFPAHRAISEADVYALENVAELDQLPPRGATVTALPMKIRGGSGAPVRILGVISAGPGS